MFCEKCGAQLEEGSVFCTNCGNKITQAQDNAQPAQPIQQNPVQPGFQTQAINPALVVKKKNPAKIIIPIVAGLLVLIIALVAVVAIFAGASKGYEKVINNYYGAINNYDAERLLDTYAEFYTDYYYDCYDESYLEECRDIVEEASDEEMNVDFAITNVKHITDSNRKLLAISLYYSYGDEYYYDQEWFEDNITDAVLATVSGTMYYYEDYEYDERISDTFVSDLLIVKAGGEWKYIPYYEPFDSYFEE